MNSMWKDELERYETQARKVAELRQALKERSIYRQTYIEAKDKLVHLEYKVAKEILRAKPREEEA